MKIDSLVRSINRRISDIANLFGVESEQYMRQKAFLYELLPDAILRINDETGIIRVRRGWHVEPELERQRDLLEKMYELQKSFGTAIEQAQPYIQQGLNRKQIKETAEMEYSMKKSSDDYIYELWKSLPDSAYKRELEEILHSRMGTHGVEAERIFKEFSKMLIDYQIKLNQSVMKNAPPPAHISDDEMQRRLDRRKRLRM